jgi:transposase
VLAKHKLSELLQVAIHERQHQRQLRAYGNRPARSETTTTFSLTISRDEKALVRLKRTLGWRVFATNQPAAQLPLAQVVLVYHDEYQVEAGMARLKGRPLSLTPMFLQREDHITGLVRLLSIALRVLTLLEFVVREALRKADEQLQGLYPGQPNRAAKRPRTETLLRAFRGITLSIITLKNSVMRHITELSTLHKRILALLGFSESLYTRLADSPISNLGS